MGVKNLLALGGGGGGGAFKQRHLVLLSLYQKKQKENKATFERGAKWTRFPDTDLHRRLILVFPVTSILSLHSNSRCS